jgi:ribonuclease HI
MELMAAIEALKALKEPCDVELYSDSKYVVDAIEQGWAEKWRANGWRRGKKGEKAVNPDLWQMLLDETERHSVSFIWVKGHHTNPENNRCDEIAVEASRASNLQLDEAYENGAGADE